MNAQVLLNRRRGMAMVAATFSGAASSLSSAQTQQPVRTHPMPSLAPAPSGTLVIQGGAVHPDTADIWQAIVADAGGPGSAIAVMPAAAANPQVSGQRLVETLTRYGAKPFVVPAAPRLAGTDHRAAARDPFWAARVRDAGGVFFSGGDQSRITDTLIAGDGSRTPLLQACWDVLTRGGVIAGTSAGAAIMSEMMFFEPADSQLALLNQSLRVGTRPNDDLAPGIGFIGPGIFVDQHLLARGRFARMLPAMRQLKIPLGYGIDENTALRVDLAKGTGSVLGASGVLIVDLRHEDDRLPLAPYRAQGVRLGLLDRGDIVHLRTAAITPSEFKRAGSMLLPHSADYKPEFREHKFYADVLGKDVLPELMKNFLDNRQTEVLALAFGAPGRKDAEAGFQFRFRKGADTRAWLRIEKGKAHYTVADVELDVEPISMAKPLFTPR